MVVTGVVFDGVVVTVAVGVAGGFAAAVVAGFAAATVAGGVALASCYEMVEWVLRYVT